MAQAEPVAAGRNAVRRPHVPVEAVAAGIRFAFWKESIL